jgi:hypothetical protein
MKADKVEIPTGYAKQMITDFLLMDEMQKADEGLKGRRKE